LRRAFLSITVALLGALIFAPAVSAGGGDRASGSGTRIPSCLDACTAGTFSFDARSGKHGGNPHGWFVVDFAGFAGFTGAVTCLDVHGKYATIYGRINAGTGFADPTTYSPNQDPLYFVLVVKDRGPKPVGRPAPDRMSLVAWDTEEGWLTTVSSLDQICHDPWTALGDSTMFGLISGNIRVVDR
jgi:hypothetical protein